MHDMDSENATLEPDPWDDPEAAQKYRVELEDLGQGRLFNPVTPRIGATLDRPDFVAKVTKHYDGGDWLRYQAPDGRIGFIETGYATGRTFHPVGCGCVDCASQAAATDCVGGQV